MSRSSQWKQLERDTAKVLKGKRVTRAYDFGTSDIDVDIPDFPSFKVDTKRRKKAQIFSLYKLIKKKYCKHPQDNPVLVIREHNSKFELAIIDLELLGKFLDFIRKYNGQKEF